MQTVWVTLAALLGFTCLSVLYFPSDNTQPWVNSTPHLLVTPSHLEAQVKWLEKQGDVQTFSLGDEGGGIITAPRNNQPLLDTIPTFFQEQILNGLPYLWGHPGPGGLFSPKYARFLQTLLDYTTYHNRLRDSTSRTLTWQCRAEEYCGGLGDRIRGVAYTLLLAMFSRRRLVIFWEDQPEAAYLGPHMIDWRDKVLFDILRQTDEADYHIETQSLSPLIFKFYVIMDGSGKITNDVSIEDMDYYQRVIGSNLTHVVLSTNLEPSSLLDSERSGNQNWIRAGLSWSGLSHLTPTDLDDTVGVIFRYLFTLRSELWAEVQSAKAALGLLPPVPYVALHLRTGFAGMEHHAELVRHPKLEHNVSVWHSDLECAMRTADTYLGNDSVVFLATDSNLVKDLALARYGARIRTLRNSLVHLDKLGKNSTLQLSAAEKEGVLVVWVEFLLLAQAEVLVRRESGYSWIAGLISGMHGNRTVNARQCILQS